MSSSTLAMTLLASSALLVSSFVQFVTVCQRREWRRRADRRRVAAFAAMASAAGIGADIAFSAGVESAWTLEDAAKSIVYMVFCTSVLAVATAACDCAAVRGRVVPTRIVFSVAAAAACSAPEFIAAARSGGDEGWTVVTVARVAREAVLAGLALVLGAAEVWAGCD